MQASLEFILGLLDRPSLAFASADDFAGRHGDALRVWQRLGFLSSDAEANPVRCCPHCREGEPVLIGARHICAACHSVVDSRRLRLWRFDVDALLAWLAEGLNLEGGVRRVDDSLWQLGSIDHGGPRYECFFRQGGQLSGRGRQRLTAYRNGLLLGSLPSSMNIEGFTGPTLSLIEILRQHKGSLEVIDLSTALLGGGAVRFDAESGALWAGETLLGEVPVGSKEHSLFNCLWEQVDRFVPYGDLKQFVLRGSGSRDTTEEATFCQRLKNRIKKRVPRIDDLIVTTNKGDGYRLRGHVGGA
jgi:hypothetical protein